MKTTKSIVLNHIWKNPGAHRKEMARLYDLHPNLVTDAVRSLLDEGWVMETNTKKTASGRSPISLAVHPTNRIALSLSYNRHQGVASMISPAGEILKRIQYAVTSDDPEEFVSLVSKKLKALENRAPGKVIGVGVSDPGAINPLQGVVVRSSSFSIWNNVPLAEWLEKRCGHPVFVEDITRTRAMAQYLKMRQLHEKSASALYLNYGDVIGLSILTPKGIWHGNGFAGEIGHVIVKPGGPLCGCGAHGCLESMANTVSLVSRVHELLAKGAHSDLRSKQPMTAEKIFASALTGDRLARGAVKETLSYLATPLAFLVSAFHPHYLIVGAESAPAISCVARILHESIGSFTLPEIASNMQVIEGDVTTDLGLVGAGMLVFENAFRQVL